MKFSEAAQRIRHDDSVKWIYWVYTITCHRNGKQYVGYTRWGYRRLKSHRSGLIRGRHTHFDLNQDYQRYGEKAFSFDVFYVSKWQNDALQVERQMIDELIREGKCYNFLPTGRLRNHHFKSAKGVQGT